MKLYVLEKGIVLTGKSWEIKQKLKEFQLKYEFVSDWIHDIHSSKKERVLTRIK
ncbi:Z-ring formation inhibitor MciZ [Peribacillus loiseleuriae]|uniref:Z-ring formation inhibitor MciZ n=1 Tax=Peribacillus loiseleuriae TaxID=1679170 RepID=UPI0009E26E55|nr:Z-ring formation inhibitor MciZ [Peribacillus loiseleuriae]